MYPIRARATGTIAAILLAATVAAGCGSDTKPDALTGTIDINGSSTVFPIMQAIGEEFRGEHGDVDIAVGLSGTGGGFEKFCRGETDISNASRPIKEEEVAACKKGGVEYVELEVAIDGLSVVVNPENDWVDCLTIDQLNEIWNPESKVDNWKDIDPSFPDEKLVLYGPGTDSGTFDYFTDEINGEEGASRSDYTASEDDNVLVQGVSGDTGSLGYFGHGYVMENTDKVRAIAIDGGNGCIEPTSATIEDGTYTPLARPLFIYVARKSAAREEVATFVDFVLDNVADLVPDVGYIPLPADRTSAAATTWSDFVAGDDETTMTDEAA